MARFPAGDVRAYRTGPVTGTQHSYARQHSQHTHGKPVNPDRPKYRPKAKGTA